jgi:hypothetical protein
MTLHQLGHIARITSAMSQSVFTAAGFLFVDDTDLITVAKDKLESPKQVTNQVQAAVEAWHGGLRASGGAMKPEKCSWCLVSSFWDHGQWFYTSPASQPGTLTIPVPNGNPVIVTCHDVSEAIKVVSMTQALDGNMDAQVMVLQTKADLLGEQISE